jgi:hypothetical protein
MGEWLPNLFTLYEMIPGTVRYGHMIYRTLRLAFTERRWIGRAVQLIDMGIDRGQLDKPEPRLVFHFTGINAALSDIELVDAEGEIRFGGDDLAGPIRVEMDAVSVSPIRRLDRFGFRLVQRVSKESADRIRNAPKPGNRHVRFGFQRVQVRFRLTEDQDRVPPRLFRIELPDEVQVDTGPNEWEVQHRLSTTQYPPTR